MGSRGGGSGAGEEGTSIAAFPGSLVAKLGKYVLHPIRMALQDSRWRSSSFGNFFTGMYGDDGPEWDSDTLQESLNKCRREGKILMVYIHSRWHPLSDVFCKEVLGRRELADALEAHEIRLWGARVESPAGYSLCTQLRVMEYPYVCLLARLPTEPSARLLGNISVHDTTFDDFLRKVDNAMQQCRPILQAAKAKMNAEMQRRETISEQNRVFEEASRRDRELEKKKREEEEAKREAAEMEAEQARLDEAVKLSQQLTLEKKIQECRTRLPVAPSSGDAGIVTILVRLADGARLIRKFYRSDTVQSIHDWVTIELYERKSNVQHFSLVSNHPTRVFEPDSDDCRLPLVDAGLAPQASLFLRDLDA